MTKKIYVDIIHGYPEKDKYIFAHDLGSELLDYLGKDVFLLLLDSRILLNSSIFLSDQSWQLTPAAKGFGGFLNKLADRKGLRKDKNDKNLGNIYSENNPRLRSKIQDSKLIKITNVTWEFCRNEILHYRKDKIVRFGTMRKKYEEIVEVVKELFQDLYNKKSIPDDDIKVGYEKYVLSKYESQLSYRVKQKIIRFINKLWKK